MDDANDLDLPFEPTDPMPMADQADAVICGGLVVRAAVVDVGEPGHVEKWPTLVWQFVTAEGAFLRPLMLVLNDDQMAKLRPVIFEAMAHSRRAAKGGE